METIYITDPVREYFKKNDFYAYLLETPIISDNLAKEFIKVADPSNKRNLHLKKYWSQISTFGKPRRIISMDLGGTNLKIDKVDITQDNNVKIIDTTKKIFYENKTYTPQALFKDLTKHLNDFIKDREEKTTISNIVFIFSYPIEQLVREDGYVDAICTFFNKTRKQEGIIGLQIGQSFQNHLRKNGYPNVSVSVTNDTPIYCLAAKAYEILHKKKFDASLNLIAGTGTNISAGFDETEIEKLKGFRIINTEFGDFRGVKLSKFDKIFDRTVDMPDRYLTEKMISGAWQHQIFKIILNDLIENKIISPAIIENIDLNNADGEKIENHFTDGTLKSDQLKILYFIWKELNKRGASICGITIARIMEQILKKSNKETIDIIILETGSVIQKGTGFREQLIDTIDGELGRLGLGHKINYNLDTLKDLSAYGAVIFDAFFPQ